MVINRRTCWKGKVLVGWGHVRAVRVRHILFRARRCARQSAALRVRMAERERCERSGGVREQWRYDGMMKKMRDAREAGRCHAQRVQQARR